jgi:hypothetical protein
MSPYELIGKQNEKILVLQMLVESLVDELIETKKVKESKLDERFQSKMQWAQEQLDRAREEVQTDYLKGKMFGNQIGEA